MAKSISGCLSQFKADVAGTAIPAELDNILNMKLTGNRSATNRKAVELARAQIQVIEADASAYRSQYEAAVNKFKTDLMESTPAQHYTSREKTDPANKLNQFKPHALAKLASNVFQSVSSFAQVLTSGFLTKHNFTDAERKVLTNISGSFLADFDSSIEALWKNKGTAHFRSEDFVQYFPDRVFADVDADGNIDTKGTVLPVTYKDSTGKVMANGDAKILATKLDSTLKGVIAATVYEELMKNPRMFLQNDYDSMKAILGITDKEADLPKGAANHLIDIGSSSTYLAEILGKGIVERLGIEPTSEAEFLAQKELEMSVGLLGLATLEHMNVLERVEVYTGLDAKGEIIGGFLDETSDTLIGMEALLMGRGDTDAVEIVVPPSSVDPATGKAVKTNKKNKPARTFYRFANPVIDSDGLRSIPEDMVNQEKDLERAPDAISKLFTGQREQRQWSFKKPVYKKDKKMRIGNSNEVAAPAQAKNLRNYNKKAWQRSEATLGAFNALSANMQRKLMGWKNKSEVYVDDRENVRGINIGIDNEISNLKRYSDRVQERADAGESTDIYIESEFWSTMRMGQMGSISPQRYKLHRAMIGMAGWETTFDVMDPKNEALQTSFLSAVAQHLDIESGKLGGIAPQLVKFQAEMETENAKDALHFTRMLLVDGELSDENQSHLVRALSQYGTKALALKGFVEYARFLDARGNLTKVSNFTTDIAIEIDGIANGPAIGLVQFIGSGADLDSVAASLLMSGWNFTDRSQNIDELLNEKALLDAYERMGHLWGKNVAVTTREVADSLAFAKETGNKKDIATLQRKLEVIEAANAIIKPLVDAEGFATKVARSLSKYKVMQLLFGAGVKRQEEVLVNEDLVDEGIKGQLEKFAATIRSWDTDGDQTTKEQKAETGRELIVFLNNVSTLIGRKFYTKSSIMTAGKVDPAKLLELPITENDLAVIFANVSPVFGKGMAAAIKELYGASMDTRKVFNSTISANVGIYNALLEAKITALQSQKLATDKAMQKRNQNREAANAAAPDKRQKTLEIPAITVGEMKAITDSLLPIFPRIKSPYYDGRNDSGYLALASVMKKDPMGNPVEVEQSYNSSTGISLNRAFVSGFPYLEDPGVSPIVNAIHMMDSTVPNDFMKGSMDVLNVHDAGIGGIGDHSAMENQLNTAFNGTMSKYHATSEFYDNWKQLTGSLEGLLADVGIEHEALFNSMLRNGAFSVEMLAFKTDRSVEEMIITISEAGPEDFSFMEKLSLYVESSAEYDGAEEFVLSAIEYLSQSSERETEITNENQDAFMSATTGMGNYSGGLGGATTGNAHVDTIFTGETREINTGDIQNTDRQKTEETAATIVEQTANLTLKSSNTVIDTDVNNYTYSADVDSKTAVEVFDSLVQMDNDPGMSTINDSPAHAAVLRKLMDDLTNNVMRPVALYINENPDVNQETAGTLMTGDRGEDTKVFIQRQNVSQAVYPQPGLLAQGIRMSTGEVYAHEITHHVTHMGLSNNAVLRNHAKNLYNQAYKGFKSKYGNEAYRVFLNNPTINVNDPANFYEVQAAQDRWEYVFENADAGKNKTSLYDEFVAHGVTNENFMRELATLEVKDNGDKALFGIFEKNIQTSIMNLYNAIQSFIYGRFKSSTAEKRMDKQLNALVQTLAKQDAQKKSAIFQFILDKEAKATLWATGKDKQIREKVGELAQKPIIVQAWNQAKKVPEFDNLISQGMRNMRAFYNDKDYGIVASVVTEVKGLTDRLKPLHELQHKRNLILDMEKQAKAQAMMKTVASFSKRKLSSREKSAITKSVVKTDLHALYEVGGMSYVAGVISDSTVRQQKIKDLNNQIALDPDLSSYADFFSRASEALGYFMATGRGMEHDLQMGNAHNIARMTDTMHEGTLSPASREKVQGIVDQLASLYAMNYVPRAEMNSTASLLTENPSLIENVAIQHGYLKDNALEKNFNGNPAEMIKGYTRAVLHPRVKFKQGTFDDSVAFEEQGYIRASKPLERDPSDPEQTDMYLYKSTLGTTNDLASQIMSYTSHISRGQSSADTQYTLAKTEMKTAQQARTDAAKNSMLTHQRAIKKLNGMFDPRPPASPNPRGVYMVPQYDATGKISTMRYIMAESTKDNELEQINDVDAVFAKMIEHSVDKEHSPQINSELVDALFDMYQKDFPENPTAYVEISSTSSEERYREIYYSIPPAAQAKIMSTFPDGKLMVSKDVIDLAFGTRKYTILEMFGKTPEDRNVFEKVLNAVTIFGLGFDPLGTSKYKNEKGRVMARAKTVEDFMKQLTMLGKNNIVVRNFSVTKGNYASNMAYLKSKGLSMDEITKWSEEAIRTAMEYENLNKDFTLLAQQRELASRKKGMSPQAKATLLKNMDRKLAQLQNDLDLNKSTPMMQAGLMPTIVDDIDTQFVQSNYEQGVDKLITDTMGKLPEVAQTVARTLFLTKDSDGYRTLNNAVRMTDYVGRYVLYNHYTKEKGMSHQNAITAVTEEFVNFSLPTHRMLEYLNNVGLVWFSKYQLRVLKQIKNLVTEQPLTALSTFLITSVVGTGNIINSLPGITKDLFQAFGDPIQSLNDSVGQITTIDAATSIFD